jgi:hypothetical protein
MPNLLLSQATDPEVSGFDSGCYKTFREVVDLNGVHSAS